MESGRRTSEECSRSQRHRMHATMYPTCTPALGFWILSLGSWSVYAGDSGLYRLSMACDARSSGQSSGTQRVFARLRTVLLVARPCLQQRRATCLFGLAAPMLMASSSVSHGGVCSISHLVDSGTASSLKHMIALFALSWLALGISSVLDLLLAIVGFLFAFVDRRAGAAGCQGR